jgi:hypothetical protein
MDLTHQLPLCSFVDRDMLMRHFGHGVGHLQYERQHETETDTTRLEVESDDNDHDSDIDNCLGKCSRRQHSC